MGQPEWVRCEKCGKRFMEMGLINGPDINKLLRPRLCPQCKFEKDKKILQKILNPHKENEEWKP